jgi:hypothetical protein
MSSVCKVNASEMEYNLIDIESCVPLDSTLRERFSQGESLLLEASPMLITSIQTRITRQKGLSKRSPIIPSGIFHKGTMYTAV